MKTKMLLPTLFLIGTTVHSISAQTYWNPQLGEMQLLPPAASYLRLYQMLRIQNSSNMTTIDVSGAGTGLNHAIKAVATSGAAAVCGSSVGNYGGYGVLGETSQPNDIGGFFTNTAAYSEAKALIVDKGRIGFGTTSPSNKLHVLGGVTIEKSDTSTNGLLYVKYSGTSPNYCTAVVGNAANAANSGIGGVFIGGYQGVKGRAQLSGLGYRYGVEAYAAGGQVNYGIYAGSGTGTNDWAGYFSGKVYSTGGYQPSDIKLKKDISEVDDALGKVMKLKAITYKYDLEKHPKLGLPKEKQIGLIAQNVESVLPDLVCEAALPNGDPESEVASSTDPNKELETIKVVNYTEMIPVLVKAIQEQQKTIEQLEKIVGKRW